MTTIFQIVKLIITWMSRAKLAVANGTSTNTRMAKFLNAAVNFTQVFASIRLVIPVITVSYLSRFRLVVIGKNFAMRKPLVEMFRSLN